LITLTDSDSTANLKDLAQEWRISRRLACPRTLGHGFAARSACRVSDWPRLARLETNTPDSTDFSPSMSGYRDRLALPRQGMTLYSPVGLLRPAPELNQKENADEDENQC
jgi:hypothetical protein